jgi:hypothetical protein
MQVWNSKSTMPFTPPGHFGGLEVLDVVGFKDRNYSVQVSKAPPGAGGELHHHDSWAQVGRAGSSHARPAASCYHGQRRCR